MKSSKYNVLLSLLMSVGMVATALPITTPRQEATSKRDTKCKQVHAELVERQTTTGCTSPRNFCASGTIRGNRGLNGTTFFSVESSAAGPSTSPGGVSYSGIFDITTPDGTLKLRETGVSYGRAGNLAGGIFASFAEILEGTGRYGGATGDVWFSGRIIEGTFLVKMRGELCVPSNDD
jgi:hypothetical protein